MKSGDRILKDLVALIAPRELLLVSADGDKYSKDADQIAEAAMAVYLKHAVPSHLQHQGYSGGHPLTQERFDFILEWVSHNLVSTAKGVPPD